MNRDERAKRAHRVAQLRARGWSYRRIADELGISTRTAYLDAGRTSPDGQPEPQPKTLLAALAQLNEDQRKALGRALLQGDLRTMDAPASRGALDF